MSKFMGIAASSLVAGLLVAVAGCSSSNTTHAASASGTEQASTASASSATGTGVSALSPTASSPTVSAPGQAPAPSTTPSSTSPQGTEAPFPGIWDITSWQQYTAAQKSVEQGHQPWLLDPASVVSAWAHRWNPVPPVVRITSDEFQVTQPGTTTVYTIRGTRPVSTGPAPIWVITSITHS